MNEGIRIIYNPSRLSISFYYNSTALYSQITPVAMHDGCHLTAYTTYARFGGTKYSHVAKTLLCYVDDDSSVIKWIELGFYA